MNTNQTPAASASRHTPEPWRVSSEPWRIHAGNEVIASAMIVSEPNQDNANASRIVACVNALAGMEPGAVAGLVAAVEKYLQVNSVGNRAVLRAALAALKGAK